MHLSSLRRFLSGLLILTTALLAGRAALAEWDNYQCAAAAQNGVAQLRLALAAAEMVSRERGPANGMLGDGTPPQPQRRLALAEARARTDSAFSDLQRVLAPARDDDTRWQLAGTQFKAAQTALRDARAEVDRIAALAQPEREPEALRAAVRGMVAVVPLLAPALSVLADNTQRDQPALANEVQGARLVAELREYAGLLGSHFTAALTRQQPLTSDERSAIDRTRGRIDQLRFLVALQVQATTASPATSQAWQAVGERYFGQAQQLVDRVIAAGQSHGQYGMDPAEFAGRYVPDMNTMFAVRDALLTQAASRAAEQRVAAGLALLLVAIGVALLAAVLAATLALSRRRYRP